MAVFSLLVSAMDLAVILVIFANTTSLGGFSREEVLFLYGASSLAFTLADTFFSNLDRISQHIKAGTLDTFLIRPVPAWIQIATDRFVPSRVGRILQAAVVLGYAVSVLGLPAGRLWMVPVMVLTGLVIFAALWTLAGALQFVLTDAPEVVNAFTYGSNQLTQYPFSIYARDLVRGLTYVLPLAFINWQPGLYVLGRHDPLGTPDLMWLAGPAVALILVLLAGLAWRQGIRHYRSTGS
ncbi:transporter [Nonomuraea sp. NN258]|nr:transporter [Nonomuraea antri]